MPPVEPMTAIELWRLFMLLGAGLVGINAIMVGVLHVMGSRRTSRKEDHDEGGRRQQLANLLSMAQINERRWEEHREWADGRLDEFRETQATVGKLALAQERMQADIGRALEASAGAAEAVTKLATGLAVRVTFGDKTQQGGNG